MASPLGKNKLPDGQGAAKDRLAATCADVCVEIMASLESLVDKLAFASSCHNALEASRDDQAWSTFSIEGGQQGDSTFHLPPQGLGRDLSERILNACH